MAHELTTAEYEKNKSEVWKTTGWLTLITIIEVSFALYWYYNISGSAPKMILDTFLIFMSLLKAYYIVAIFMHLKYETKVLQMTVLLPLLLTIWGIIAFLLEGKSIHHLRHLFSI